MGYLDFTAMAIFTFIVVICGISFSGAGKSMKSFFAGNGAVPWWISGLSLFMSFFSAGTFVVWGAIAYNYGWVAVAIQWTMCLSGFVIGIFIAPKWQKTGVLTAAEFITKRLGYRTQKIYSYLFLFLSVFTTGAFLYPVAKILEVATDIPIIVSTVVLGALIILYTAIGGIWAVIITDVLQFIVLTVAVFIVVPLAFDQVGGVSAFFRHAPDNFFHFTTSEYSLGFLLAFALYNLFYISGNWAYVQRYTTVRTPKDAKKVGFLFGFLYIISPVIWMLPPMIYRVVNPELSHLGAEGAYLLISKAVLPVGMIGMMLGAMIFATSSSVNTTLNISAGVFTNDLYKPLFPKSSEKQLIKVARYATVIFGLLTIIVALLVPVMGGIVDVVISIGALTGAPLFLPPLWCLFSKRQTGRSVLTTTIVSLIINFFFKFVSPLFGLSLSRSMEMIVGVGVPIVIMIAYEVALSFLKKENRAYDNYKATVLEKSTTAEEESQVDIDNKHGQKVIALGVFLIGVMTIIVGFISIRSSGVVFISGILVLAVSLIMYPYKRQRKYTPIEIKEK